MRSDNKDFYFTRKGKPLTRELQHHHQRRSKNIIFLRKFLCVSLVIMVATLLTWPHIEEFLNYTSSGESESLKKFSLHNKIHQPSMYSYDKDQRPFNINADSAEHITSEELNLEKPFSKHLLQSGVKVEINGQKGHFHQKTKLLNYKENVKLTTSSGYEFTTSSALVDTNNKKVSGSETIVGKGPSGDIIADGFIIENGGDTIHFTGKSTLTLNSMTSKNKEEKRILDVK